MSRKGLCFFARLLIFLIALFAAVFYGIAVPFGGYALSAGKSLQESGVLPWLVLMELPVIPDFAALFAAWQIAGAVVTNQTRSPVNTRRFQRILLMTVITAVVFFAGFTAFLLLNRQKALTLDSFSLSFTGTAVTAAALVISCLLRRV